MYKTVIQRTKSRGSQIYFFKYLIARVGAFGEDFESDSVTPVSVLDCISR